MNYKQILELLNSKPFKPFRIYMSDHKTYDIEHPDFVFVDRTHLLIVTPGASERSMLKKEFVGLIHIVRIEQLQPESHV